MKCVLIGGSRYDNEQLVEKLYEYIRQQSVASGLVADYLLAYPRARRQSTRLAESDMNRIYNQLRNSKPSAGFYPVLFAEEAYRAYTQYAGFRANSMARVDVWNVGTA